MERMMPWRTNLDMRGSRTTWNLNLNSLRSSSRWLFQPLVNNPVCQRLVPRHLWRRVPRFPLSRRHRMCSIPPLLLADQRSRRLRLRSLPPHSPNRFLQFPGHPEASLKRKFRVSLPPSLGVKPSTLSRLLPMFRKQRQSRHQLPPSLPTLHQAFHLPNPSHFTHLLSLLSELSPHDPR